MIDPLSNSLHRILNVLEGCTKPADIAQKDLCVIVRAEYLK